MADGDSSNREVRVVTLVIKNPSTTSLGDFRMQMPVEATVLAVKQRLQRDYQGNPEPSKQKLIVGGQFVKDSAPIREIFKQKDLTEPLMMHLMVSSSGTESSPVTTSTPTFSSSSPIPSSSPAISSVDCEQAGRNSRQVATSSSSPASSPFGVTSNNVSQLGVGSVHSHGGNEVSASRPQEFASPSQNSPPTLTTNATPPEAMEQTSGLVSGTATQGGEGASSSTSPPVDGFAPAGAPGPSQTTSIANPGGVGQTGTEGPAFPAGPLPPETVNLAMLQMMYGGMMLNPLAYSPAMAAYNAALLNPAAFGGLGPHYPGYMAPFCPPAMAPPYFPVPGDQQQRQQAGGVYAMPPMPGGGMGAAGFNVMPFNVPLGAPLQAMPQGVQEAGQMGPQMARRPQAGEAYAAQAARLRQRHGQAAGAAIPVQENAIGGQAMFVQHIGQDGRQPVVRRIRIHLRLDLMLIAKLAVLVFAFNQGGEASRTRTLLLSGAAVLFYLYQTGALAPLHRWFAQGTRHVLGQPLQPPPADPQNNGLGNQARGGPAVGAVPVGGQGTGVGPEGPPLQQQRDRRGVLREIQVFLMGFLVSLLPGFHAPDDPLVREPEDLAQGEAVPNPPHQD